jgi:hypothetical protein
MYILVDVDTRLAWTFPWDNFLADGDEVATHAWTITPSGPVIDGDDQAAVVVSGFAPGVIYRLVCSIVSTHGVEELQALTIMAEQNV